MIIYCVILCIQLQFSTWIYAGVWHQSFTVNHSNNGISSLKNSKKRIFIILYQKADRGPLRTYILQTAQPTNKRKRWASLWLNTSLCVNVQTKTDQDNWEKKFTLLNALIMSEVTVFSGAFLCCSYHCVTSHLSNKWLMKGACHWEAFSLSSCTPFQKKKTEWTMDLT